MFELSIRKKNISYTLEAINTLVEECKIHITDGHMAVRAMDPANVGMIDLSLTRAAFESYNVSGEEKIGVNTDRFQNVVNMANSDDLIHITLEEETRNISIKFNGLSYTLSLIDPDSIREEPDIPDLDLPAEIIVESQKLKEATRAANMISEHITLNIPSNTKEFHLQATGDTDEVDYTIKDSDVISGEYAEAHGMYSLDYLKSMIGTVPKNAEMRIRVGEDFPTKMNYTTAEGECDITYMLAPRIESD